MSDSRAIERLRRAALLAGMGDWLNMGLLAGLAHDLEPDLDPSGVRRTVLATVYDVAAEGLMVIGSLDPGNERVAPWHCSPREAVDRLGSEWDALLDDGWMENTTEVDRIARWLQGQSDERE